MLFALIGAALLAGFPVQLLPSCAASQALLRLSWWLLSTRQAPYLIPFLSSHFSASRPSQPACLSSLLPASSQCLPFPSFSAR